ncbi:Bardet-Biedl syndrome 5 protein homolog [Microplitis demolitor]|uniref:Bardet-Biedl syndrome 5 protein homolog n=1 Tax=Microplitis demolitor TaxID=69319 RepID=UPI0004400370|nr:Bardet-Biedl syndrome 5 protein homolog [Microplitis demolitor]XP_053598185.1 Bardet-Biedl syndrome 5 protein homolog [Microplitis demolitor]
MWQDHEVRFDVSLMDLQIRDGESLIDKLDMIEDTKGNAGDQGRLMVTNLRIIWHSLMLPRINLSIGYDTIVNVSTKMISVIQGTTTQALHILTSFKNCKYEFIFTNLNTKNFRHYTSVTGVFRAYMSTKAYREIKLRGAFVQNKALITLPSEIISSTTLGVWNLSTEQGNVGTFVITNIRIVWFADMNPQFNVSLPYLAMENASIKSSKFGPTLVIISTKSSNGYVLGFRVDPIQKLHILHKEIQTLKAAYDKNPIYGVDYTFEYQGVIEPEVNEPRTNEIQDTTDEISNVFGLYFAEDGLKQRQPQVDSYLGLAAEEPRPGISLQSLWELIPGNT